MMNDKYYNRIVDLLDAQWWYYIGQYHNKEQLAYYYGMREAFDAMLLLEHSVIERNELGKHCIVGLPQ